MKIAYTMNGLVGGLFGKHYNADTGDESTLVIKYISNNFRKYITSSFERGIIIFMIKPKQILWRYNWNIVL
jgi:hypothetical protein